MDLAATALVLIILLKALHSLWSSQEVAFGQIGIKIHVKGIKIHVKGMVRTKIVKAQIYSKFICRIILY